MKIQKMNTLLLSVLHHTRGSALDGNAAPIIENFRNALVNSPDVPVELVDILVVMLHEVLVSEFPEMLEPAVVEPVPAELGSEELWGRCEADIQAYFDQLYTDAAVAAAKFEYVRAVVVSVPPEFEPISEIYALFLEDAQTGVENALSDAEREVVMSILRDSAAVDAVPAPDNLPSSDVVMSRIASRRRGYRRRSRRPVALLAQLGDKDWVLLDRNALAQVAQTLVSGLPNASVEALADPYNEQLQKEIKNIKTKRVEELGRGECFISGDFLNAIDRNKIIDEIEKGSGKAWAAFTGAIAKMMDKTLKVYEIGKWEYANGKVRDISSDEPGQWKAPKAMSLSRADLAGEPQSLWVVFDAPVLIDALMDALDEAVVEYNTVIGDSGSGTMIAGPVVKTVVGRAVNAVQTKKVKQLDSEVCAKISSILSLQSAVLTGELSDVSEFAADLVSSVLSDYVEDAVAISKDLAVSSGFTYNTTSGQFIDADQISHAPELLRAFSFLKPTPGYMSIFRAELRKQAALESVWTGMRWRNAVGHEATIMALDAAISSVNADCAKRRTVTVKQYSDRVSHAVASVRGIMPGDVQRVTSLMLSAM